MTTDVGQALEVIAVALAGMALLIVLLVLAERFILRMPVPRVTVEPTAAPADAVSASAAP